MAGHGSLARGSFNDLQSLLDGSHHKSPSLKLKNSTQLDTAMDSSSGVVETSERVVIVSMQLPLSMVKREDREGWDFKLNKDALLVNARAGFPDTCSVLHVGCLPSDVPLEEQESVSQELADAFDCMPVFLDEDLRRVFYKEFCKQTLWPLLHYLLPLSSQSTGRFQQDAWTAYMKANRAFADKIMQVLRPEADYIWIHDYHLLVLPALLRKRSNKMRCGVFLHSPFPSSEIFRAFPKREEVLRSFLTADLVGFQSFDYARHFLSCCARQLGVEHQTHRGSIVLDYFGRKVYVKILPTTVQPEGLLECFSWDDTAWRRGELLSEHAGKTVLLGMDDLDVFKGIELKLHAMEHILDRYPHQRSTLVLVQVIQPARSQSKEIECLREEITTVTDRVNGKYGTNTHKPIVLIQRPVPPYERSALFSIADCAVLTATRDGMNLMPYEYVVCRQGPDSQPGPRQSTLVVSEFVGCSPSLSGALRVNPWSAESVSDGILQCISMSSQERALRHDKHWKYLSKNTVKHWAAAYLKDLKHACAYHSSKKFYGLGLGLDTFRMVAMDINFRRLDVLSVNDAYLSTRNRVFLLDYDQTLMATTSFSAAPSKEVLATVGALSAVPENTVIIVSGRGRKDLEGWFKPLDNVGLAAEHGFYFKPPGSEDWEANTGFETNWQDMVLPVLEHYVECTDGSYIEKKESALVWHYRDTDPDFASWQAKELLDHLESVLANEPVEAVRGSGIVEVKPQGVSKGLAAEKVLELVKMRRGEVDFVFCVGDDRSDEEMFAVIEDSIEASGAKVFTCTVGAKPSRAPSYLDDPSEVVEVLRNLAIRDPQLTDS